MPTEFPYDYSRGDVLIDPKTGAKLTNIELTDTKKGIYSADVSYRGGQSIQSFTWGDLMLMVNLKDIKEGKKFVNNNTYDVLKMTGKYLVSDEKKFYIEIADNIGNQWYVPYVDFLYNHTAVFTNEDVFNFKSSIRDVYTPQISASINLIHAFNQCVDVDNLNLTEEERTIHLLQWSEKMKSYLNQTSFFFSS